MNARVTKAELQAWAGGKLDPIRRGEIEAYLAEHPDRLADLEPLPDDGVVVHLRGAKEVPLPPKRSLLDLAIEAVVPVVAGCAGAMAGGVEGGLAGVVVGQVAEKAIVLFGGRIVNGWLAWLRRQPLASQAAAVAELADVSPEVARAQVAAALAERAPQASDADRLAAAEYLSAIPRAALRSLSSDRKTLLPTVSVDDSLSLLRLLPASLPPYAAPCELPGTGYRLEELVGTGGFGAVYRATLSSEQYLHRAIKFCLAPAMLPILRRERENLRRLIEAGGSSSRIVRLYGYDLEHATPYLVYEYVAGGDLASWLERGKRPTPAEALGIVVQVSEALAFAHGRGLVHRDLKPANLLMEDGTVKLADFGIGGTATHAAQASLLRGAGTPLYADPEQRDGKAPDPRHDLYSLGVTWYQLLVGDVRREMRHGWERELEQRGVPGDHVEALRRCVGYFGDRPRDAGELLRLLPRPDAGPLPLPAPVPIAPGRESPDDLRRQLLLDLTNDGLRLRYLLVRTPEMRARDGRHEGVGDSFVMLAGAVVFALVAFVLFVISIAVIAFPGFLALLPAVPAVFFGIGTMLARRWLRAQEELGPLPTEWKMAVMMEETRQRKGASVERRLDAFRRAAVRP